MSALWVIAGIVALVGFGAASLRFPGAVLALLLVLLPLHILGLVAFSHGLLPVARGGGPPLRVIYATDAALLSALALVAIVAGRRSLLGQRHRRLRRFLVVYLLLAAIMGVTSPTTEAAGWGFMLMAAGPVILLAVLAVGPSRRVVRLAIAGFLVTAGAVAAVGLVEQHLGATLPAWLGVGTPDLDGAFYAAHGTGYRSGSALGSPLWLGFYLAAAVPLAIGVACAVRRWGRLTVAALALVVVAALTVTGTRAGYAGAAAGGVLAALLATRSRMGRALVAAAVVTTGAAIVAVGYANHVQQVVHSGADNAAHLATVKSDLDLIAQHPLGYGLGVTDVIGQSFDTTSLPQGLATEDVYLSRGLQGGVPGMVLYLLSLMVLSVALLDAWADCRRAGDLEAAGLAAAALGVLLAASVAGLFLGIEDLAYLVLVWGSAGLALAVAPAVPVPRRAAVGRTTMLGGRLLDQRPAIASSRIARR